MTYEYAAYFRILLLCGYNNELEQYVDNALIEQDPLSDIILELATTGPDNNKKLSVLNEYLLQVKDSDIDYDKTVFELIMSFLRKRYIEDTMSMGNAVELMHHISVHTKRYLDEPWSTMNLMWDLYSEAESGYIDKAEYQHKFDAFLKNGICFSDYPPTLPKESFLKKIIKASLASIKKLAKQKNKQQFSS